MAVKLSPVQRQCLLGRIVDRDPAGRYIVGFHITTYNLQRKGLVATPINRHLLGGGYRRVRLREAGEAERARLGAWEGETCEACGAAYATIYWLPDDVWAAITPKPAQPAAGTLCPACADQRARDAGISLEWRARRG